MKKYPFNIIFFLLFFIGCSNNNSNKNSVTADKDLPEIYVDSSKENNYKADYQYGLKNPKRTWKLSS